MRLLLHVLGGALFLLCWLLPNHYPPWTTFHSEAAAFAALIAFCLGSVGEARRVGLPWRTCGIFAALVLLIWIQRAAGLITYSGDALVSSVFVAGMALAWWHGARSALKPEQSDQAVVLAAVLLVTAAAISSYIALQQWLRLDLELYTITLGPGMRPFANMAQPNLLATLLVMGTAMAYLLYERRYLKPWQFAVLALHLSVGLVLTESRAGLLGAFCAGAFFLLRGKPAWRRGGWRMVATWWAGLLLLTLARGPVNEALLLQQGRPVVLAVDNVRMTIWTQMLAAIGQSPWAGYGWRQTMAAQRHGIASVPGHEVTEYAHNVALDIVAWVGIPLGLLLLLLLAWWLLRTVRGLKNSTELLLFTATIPFLVHSMLEFPFAYAYFLLTMAWIFGALHARQRPQNFTLGRPSRLGQALLLAALLGFALLCGRIASEYLAAEEDTRVMRFEMRRLGVRPPGHEAPRLVLLTQLDEMLNMGRMKPRRGMPAEDLERMRKANMTLNWEALYVNYVIALALNGQADEASRQLQGLRALWGDKVYRLAVEELHEQRDSKYPELGTIKTP